VQKINPKRDPIPAVVMVTALRDEEEGSKGSRRVAMTSSPNLLTSRTFSQGQVALRIKSMHDELQNSYAKIE